MPDPAADCQGGEHDGQVCLDGVAFAVVDGAGLAGRFGHLEGALDLEEAVAGADREVRGDGCAVWARLQATTRCRERRDPAAQHHAVQLPIPSRQRYTRQPARLRHPNR